MYLSKLESKYDITIHSKAEHGFVHHALFGNTFEVPRVNAECMKRTIRDWLKVIILLLDEVIAVFVVVLVLRFLEINIPLPITITIGLLFGILVFIIHKAIIPSFHWKIVTGSEVMIGKRAKVVKPLNPAGTVSVDSELWNAKSIEGNIERNETVEIVGLDRLTLEVKRQNSPR